MKGTYKHYKGGKFTVIGKGRSYESNEELVFFSDEDSDLRAWPADIFNQTVNVNGETIKRFKRID